MIQSVQSPRQSMVSKGALIALRVVIIALLGSSLFVQAVMLPLAGRDMTESADILRIRTPILILVALTIATVQVALICVWKLLTMAAQGRVFSPGAFRFVDIIIGCCAAAAVIVFGMAVVMAPGGAIAPGIVLLVCGMSLVAIGIGLLVLVLRMLLGQAVATDTRARELQDELSEVI